ncbi:HPP family-domain-containing protein [Panaeolus papilionaceus]|nr:HPP family-domain-containing protein [Panaeolus papilionaceus]
MTHHHHHPHPPSRLSRLPPFISHFLGYRTHPLPARPPHIIYLWSFIGSFVGLAVIQAVFGQANYFMERGVPGVVASYGATAVLIYGAIEAPLAQPLPTFGGHLLGALVGVCITKLFGLIKDQAKFESLLWLSGSLACSTTIVLMQMTGTTHPPAGATALLASTNTEIRLLGWYYLPVVMLTSVLVLIIAMVNNNIQRRYPVFWFTPGTPRTAFYITPPASRPPDPVSETQS